MNLKLLLVLPMLFISFSTAHFVVPQTSVQKQATKIKTRLNLAKNDIICLTRNIYMEARGETFQGQIAVAIVTLNRVKSDKYPDTVCEVVYQYKQFSWTLSKPPKTINEESWDTALQAAKLAIKSHYKHNQNITHYHTKAVKPYWRNHLTKIITIGNHIFYG